MLELKNIYASYEKTNILKGINLKANPNEITLIIGPNGSGKSTILKSIYNLTQINKGNVNLDDIELTNLKPYELIKFGISFVLQRNTIFSTLLVKENLQVAASNYLDKTIAQKEIEKTINFFPFLKSKLNEKANTLSGGQQRQLAIAMALVQNPKVLLLDEPSVGLSPKAVKEVFEIISRIKQEGLTILLVEQNVKLASQIADKIYLIEDGKVILSGGNEILKQEKIKKAYLGN